MRIHLKILSIVAAFSLGACTDTSFNGGANSSSKKDGKEGGSDTGSESDAGETEGEDSEDSGIEGNGYDDSGNDDAGLGGGDSGFDDNIVIDEDVIQKCRENEIEKPDEVGNVPQIDNFNYAVGDMDRKKISSSPIWEKMAKHVNSACEKNNAQWASYTPTVSGDKATRDLVCRIYGYLEAGDEFGYFKRASPKNDWAGHWDATAKQYKINLDASGAPTNNINALWTSCRGKMFSACKQVFLKKDLKCKSAG